MQRESENSRPSGRGVVKLDSALRFERALGFSAESWMRMQLSVDTYDAIHGRAARSLGRIKPIARAF
jgi:plasmid maintenance system antidote protein VapI